MTDKDIRDDLAFMRSLVAGGGESMQSFGRGYFAAGICYGFQCVLSGTRTFGWPPGDGRVDLIIGLGPTIIFLALLTWLMVRERGTSVQGSGTSRAINAIFACVGLTNLVLVAAIGVVALKQQSIQTWLIYPCVVMILQGMAWLFAYMLRRQAWLGLIAGGWFLTGVAMAAALGFERLDWYVIIAGLALFAFMAAPGAYMMRPAPQAG
jgi:hypothetical protein